MRASRDRAQQDFRKKIVTEIEPAESFYRAEEYHQRYFEKSGRRRALSSSRRPRPLARPGESRRFPRDSYGGDGASRSRLPASAARPAAA